MLKKFFPALVCILLLASVSACSQTSPTSTDLSTGTNVPTTATPSQPYPFEAMESPLASDIYPVTSPTPTPGTAGVPIAHLSIFPSGAGWGYDLDQSAIFHTADSAATWANVSPTEADLAGRSGAVFSFFLDGLNAWFSLPNDETSFLYHTSNGGTTWTANEMDTSAGSMYFLDAQVGYLLSCQGIAAGSEYVALYFTEDAGLTWQQRFAQPPEDNPTSLPSAGNKSGFTFLDVNNGWVSGNVPVSDFIYLYHTVNGGVNWDLVSINLPDAATDNMYSSFPPIFTDQTTGFLPVRKYAADNSSSTLIFTSTDAGGSWNYLSSIPDTIQHEFVDGSTGWAMGESSFFRTTDGAHTWKDLTASLPAGLSPLNFDFVDSRNGYLVATTADMNHLDENYLYQTEDGGETWQLLSAKLSE
ncbi:MAG: hypothetical protein WA116_04790 [Anaerolineaceae bacterium]